MSRPIVKFHNLKTDKITEREMNDDEFAQYEIDVAKAEAETIAKAEAETKKSALLEKLGITEEEAKLLLS